MPTFVEVKGQATACVLKAHGPVVISHHCHRRVKILLINHPSCILSSTEVGVALPAIDQGEQSPFTGVNESISNAPRGAVWVGLVDALDYRVVADGQRVDAANVAWYQADWRWWVRVGGRRSRTDGGVGRA